MGNLFPRHSALCICPCPYIQQCCMGIWAGVQGPGRQPNPGALWRGDSEQAFVWGSAYWSPLSLSLSPPTGIAPLQPLAKGKAVGTPASLRQDPGPSPGPDTSPPHTGHLPASRTNGGRRGGRWMMGWLRGAHSAPVSRQCAWRVGQRVAGKGLQGNPRGCSYSIPCSLPQTPT